MREGVKNGAIRCLSDNLRHDERNGEHKIEEEIKDVTTKQSNWMILWSRKKSEQERIKSYKFLWKELVKYAEAPLEKCLSENVYIWDLKW